SLPAVRAGKAQNIPLLIGSNRDEMKFYAPAKRPSLGDDALRDGVQRWLPREHAERAAEVVATFKASRQQRGLAHDNHDILDAVDTVARFTLQASRLAEAQAQHQPNTYQY